MKSACKKYMLVTVEIVAALVLVLALIAVFTFWRIQDKPLDISFAQDYIEGALRSEETGRYAKMDGVSLFWPKITGPLYVRLENSTTYDENDQKIITIKDVLFSLSIQKMMMGQFVPKAMIFRNPVVTFINSADGRLNYGFGSAELLAPENRGDEPQMALMEKIISLISEEGSSGSTSPLAGLERFEIQNARVIVKDEQTGFSALFGDVNAQIAIKGGGVALLGDLDLPGSPLGKKEPDINFKIVINKATKAVTYEAGVNKIEVSNIYRNLFPFGELQGALGEISGRFDGHLNENFVPITSTLFLSSAEGLYANQSFYDEPVKYSDFQIEAALQDGQITVNKAHVTLNDKTQLTARSNLAFVLEDDKAFALEGRTVLAIPELFQSDIQPLMPLSEKGEPIYQWLVEKLSDGRFFDLEATFDMSLNAPSGFSSDGTEMTSAIRNFKSVAHYEAMTVDYRAPLTPVTNSNGKGIFDWDSQSLDITVEKADLGLQKLTDAKIELRQIIDKGTGRAKITIPMVGPLSDIFRYISQEPIRVNHKFQDHYDDILGVVASNLIFTLPTTRGVKMTDMRVTGNTLVKNGQLPHILKDLNLTTSEMQMTFLGDSVRVQGDGLLADRPVTVDWSAHLFSEGKTYETLLKASLTVDENLRQYLGIDLSEFVTGSMPSNIEYTEFSGDRSRLNVAANLQNADLYLTPFQYNKPPGLPAEMTFNAILQNENLVQIQDLNLTAPDLKLTQGQLVFSKDVQGRDQVSQAAFSEFQLGETNTNLLMEREGENTLKFVFEGPVFDLRPFLKSEKKELPDKPRVKLFLSASELITSDVGSVQNTKIYAEVNELGKFNQLEMDALSGSGAIYLRFKPDLGGQRNFILEADDAGAMLGAFGLYDNVVGGTMSVYAEPVGGLFNRNLVGTAKINNFKVVKAPSLAKLVSAMSVTGLLTSLNTEGLDFTELEAEFDWLYRPEGSLLVVNDGRTSGNSLGLTFGGTFDNAKSNMDVAGTIVPLSGINKVVSNIPIVGQILSGGSDSVFAATYTLKGPAEDPQASVNPLSVLAPGLLRRIFFEPDVEKPAQ